MASDESGGPAADEAEDPTPGLPRPSARLTALTTSALALPGVVGTARADAPIDQASAAYSYSYYFEDNLSPSRFSGQGSRSRYEVDTHQLRFDLPVSERVDVGLDFLYESMSGASPWFVTTNAQGEPVQVMSGATINDNRYDVLADIDFYMDRGKDTLSGGVSLEDDYTSVNVGIGTERNFNDKNTTFNAAGTFSYDWIDPVDSNLFDTRPDSEEKWSIDLFAGLAQILTRASTMQFTINYKHSDGYLSDPYKAIRGLGPSAPLLSDERPDTKDQASFLLRYRHHIEPINASAHADYRFYIDDWGSTSHTFEVAWYQNFFEWLTITPSFRWYSQSQADFYDTVLPIGSVPSERSSDYRLSPYGAYSWKIKAEVEFQDVWEYNPPGWLEAVGFTDGVDLIAALSFERYFSDGDLAIVTVSERDEAPGLVRFRVVAFTLNGRF